VRVSNWELPSFSRRQEPIAYFRGYGVDLTTLLVVAHIVAAVAAAFAFSAGYQNVCSRLFLFHTETFWQGYFWTPLTDPFFHNLAQEHIWFVVNMIVLWRFGKDLEQYLGRASFGLFYVLLVLIPVIFVLISAKLWGQPTMIRVPFMSIPANFGVFVGFCIVYPSVIFWPGIAAKWLGLVYSAVVAVAILAIPAPMLLIPYLSCLGTAYVYMNYCGANRMFDPLEWAENWKQDRAIKKFEVRQKQFVEEKEDFNDAVNPILDKIAKEGIQSLTAQEKQKLENARAQLLKREKQNRR